MELGWKGDRVNRRGFLACALAASTLAAAEPWLTASWAATEDELAFANFGVAVEFLLEDFYTRALEAKVVAGADAALLHRVRSAAAQHAKALSDLLVGAGDVAPLKEDFAFQWPAATFRSARAATTAGLDILHALLGVYQTAGASVGVPSYRVLYASLAASVGQQLGALTAVAGRRDIEPFPVAVELETATSALERYLG
jgi:hypothetical protein